MKIDFKKNYFFNMLFLFGGLFLIGLFVFVGYKDNEATKETVRTGILFGAIISVCNLFALLFNFKAELTIESDRIKGNYGFFSKIDCHVSDVDFVMAQTNTLILFLKNGKTHTIMGIRNAWALSSFIRKNITLEVTEPPEVLMEKRRTIQSKIKKHVVYLCFGMALMFINIFVAAFLTGWRDLHEFSKTDWIIFSIMGVVELAIIVVTFYFAVKPRKYKILMHKLNYMIQKAVIETTPLLSGNAIQIFSEENYSGRITIFGYPNDPSVYYSVEKTDLDYRLIHTFTSDVYESIEQLSDNFEELIDITKNFLYNETAE